MQKSVYTFLYCCANHCNTVSSALPSEVKIWLLRAFTVLVQGCENCLLMKLGCM